MDFPVFTPDTAPDGSRERLAGAKRAFGFLPNMLGTMAGAPALLESYLTLSRLFDETSLTPSERQVVLLAVSAENGCSYCVAAHTAIAAMQHVPNDVVHAVREGLAIREPRLEALRTFTRAVVSRRGHPAAQELHAFQGAGFSSQHVLEVVLGVGMKTISNYTNHLADTPLDEAFAAAAWGAHA
jgi:uncharacterized peroxidase-related enzyme